MKQLPLFLLIFCSATFAQEQDIVLELIVEPRQAYVQQQILVTVRLSFAVEINDLQLTKPRLEGVDAVLTPLEQRRDQNQQYQVIEQSYAVFPQQTGTLEIGPVSFHGEIGYGRQHSFDLLNERFFQDQPVGQLQRIRSERFAVTIVPAPTDQSFWLPAKRLQLTDSWSHSLDQIKVGQPLTHTLVITTDGLSSAQLPVLTLPLPDHFKQYPDQPQFEDQVTPTGLVASRTQKTAIMPTMPGTIVLPTITVQWWNTQTQAWNQTSLPERTLKVVSAASPVNPKQPPQLVERIVQELIDQSTQWLFLLAWGLTAFGWWWTAQRCHIKKKKQQKKSNPNSLLTQIKRAYRNRNAPQAKQALLAWGQCRWPEQAPKNLVELGRFCHDKEIAAALALLDHALYRPDSQSTWYHMVIWRRLKHLAPTKIVSTKDSLAHLHSA